MPRLIRPKRVKQTMTLRMFHERRNKVLILRGIGGLGDILMHRMVFEDFKKANPEMKIVFACPTQFFDAVKDHPYVDEVVNAKKVNTEDYMLSYNTTNCCSRYEMGIAPFADKNRSDIWANHCGVKLENHNMHIQLSKEELEFGKVELAKIADGTKPTVAVCPISAMRSKNLLDHQLIGTVKGLREMGLFVYSTHPKPIKTLQKIDVPTICGLTIRQWMGLLMATDYVVSVDTAAFHFAGGMNRPVVGIFTWADGYVYGKHYPTKTIVQLHRNTHPDWKCGPCYKWPECPFTTKPEKPCLTKLTVEMILEGVKTMLNKHKIYPNYN